MPSPPPAAGSRPDAPSHPCPLPPWLWVWAAGLLAAMPRILAESWGSARAFYAVSWIPPDLAAPIAIIHAFIAGFALLPCLVLLAGVLLAALPGRRARRLVRRYRLEPAAAAGGSLSEIAAFVHGHAPELEVRAYLGRMNPLAFVFPLGLRRSAIAVFGGLVRLWRRDRAAAEAVLLHEIAHHRQGDPLIIGTGSFLTPALGLWPLAVLAFALSVGLLDLAFARPLERFAAAYAQVAPPELGPPPEGSWDVVFFFLHDFVWFLHPSLIGTVGQLALWFLAVAVLPILAIWCAELTADRFTTAQGAHRQALLRALSATAAPAGRRGGFRRLLMRPRVPAFLLRGLTHPPGWLRRLLASGGGGAAGLLATVVIFPAGYLASTVIVVTMGWIAASSRGEMHGVGLLAYLAGGVPFILAGIWVQLAIVAGLLLAWPWLRPWWLRLIARRRPPVELRDAPVLGLAGAAMLVLIAAVDPFAPVPRTDLEAYQARAEADRPPLPPEGPAIRAVRAVFRTGEPIVVILRDLPGPLENWVTIVSPGTPADRYLDSPGQWDYTHGLVDGEMTLAPQLPGPYEVRLYLDWPAGGTEIRSFDRLQVIPR